jgi:hypothetical protein
MHSARSLAASLILLACGGRQKPAESSPPPAGEGAPAPGIAAAGRDRARDAAIRSPP